MFQRGREGICNHTFPKVIVLRKGMLEVYSEKKAHVKFNYTEENIMTLLINSK